MISTACAGSESIFDPTPPPSQSSGFNPPDSPASKIPPTKAAKSQSFISTPVGRRFIPGEKDEAGCEDGSALVRYQ